MNRLVVNVIGRGLGLGVVAFPVLLLASDVPSLEPVRYMSEEHRLMADIGAGRITIPASVTLPGGVSILHRRDEAVLHRQSVQAAKELAVGYNTNAVEDYDKWQYEVQDNCYWNLFAQAADNKKIWINAAGNADTGPERVLYVPTFVNTATAILARDDASYRTRFTFGELVSFYGDYRRTPYCDVGECYLTHADISDIRFDRGSAGWSSYCPPTMSAHVYLKRMASGLVPPYGGLANTFANTAELDEFDEAGWWGDEFLRLANTDDMHFSSAAVAWYTGMHRLALLYADSAQIDDQYWIKALHYEANGLHSLTDIFALGHMVTKRGTTSYGIVRRNGLQDDDTYEWMEHINNLGGGDRWVDVEGTGGEIHVGESSGFSDPLPPIESMTLGFAMSRRNDFLNTNLGSWRTSALGEHRYHDYFNQRGARVRNFNGDEMFVYGDGELRTSGSRRDQVPARTAMAMAVQTSLQQLLDAYDALASDESTVEEIGAKGSVFFEALKYIPVFIIQENTGQKHLLWGQWTAYATWVNDLAGLGHENIDADCVIDGFSGQWAGGSISYPTNVKTEACTSFGQR